MNGPLRRRKFPDAACKAKSLRRADTPAEKLLWAQLRRNAIDGHHFRRQAPVGPYIADFACLRASLLIEVDGDDHHQRHADDVRRDRTLADDGYRVLRFSNAAVHENLEGVVETIRNALQEVSR